MNVHWYCYRFDYEEYVRLRPALRAATSAAALEALAQGPEPEAIADALTADEITITEARAAFVQAICCYGEPIPFDPGLPRILSALERYDGMEDCAHLLIGMLSGGHNMEPWLQPSSGLVGFLTPQEASALYVSYVAWRAQMRLQGRLAEGRLVEGRLAEGRVVKGRVVKGRVVEGRVVEGRVVEGRLLRRKQTRGLLPACIGLLRHLLNGGPEPEEAIRLLGQLLDDAARNACGIAAIVAKQS